MVLYKVISSSQSVPRFGKSSKDCNVSPPNWKDDLSSSFGWVSYGECISVYNYTLDMAYGESWHKDINFHDSPYYFIAYILNLERILSLCQNQ